MPGDLGIPDSGNIQGIPSSPASPAGDAHGEEALKPPWSPSIHAWDTQRAPAPLHGEIFPGKSHFRAQPAPQREPGSLWSWDRRGQAGHTAGTARGEAPQPRAGRNAGKEEAGKRGGLVGSRRRGKINQERSGVMQQPGEGGWPRSGGLPAPTSAPTLLCLEGSIGQEPSNFHSSRKSLGRGMGQTPGQPLRPGGLSGRTRGRWEQ